MALLKSRFHSIVSHCDGRATALLLVVLMSLQGCSSVSQSELANPTPIHRNADSMTTNPSNLQVKAQAAADLVPLRYYNAMEAAQVASVSQQALDNYISEGVTVIELYCLRWFAKLEDAQRSFQVADTNRNVITQLGTTAIGLAKLNSEVTAAYGAINTAVGGFNANFTSAFLAAPNAENVKRLTIDALHSRALVMKTSGSALYSRSFSEAYLQLEKLAGQCTFQEIKRLTTKSIDQSNVSTDPKNGDAIVFSAAPIVQATVLKTRIETILSRIDALKPDEATAIVRIMPLRGDPSIRSLLGIRDPNNLRLTDEKVARSLLKSVFVLTAKSDSTVSEWESRLDMLSE